MWTFILAGGLYLVGVAVILVIKPSFMFTPDGNWKEFGIGQNADKYTPFPFWVFCILWAIVSYTIVLLIFGNTTPYNTNEPIEIVKTNAKRNKREVTEELTFDDEIEAPNTLKKGYYVLNKKASRLAGVPKYVYMGEEDIE